MALVYKCPSCGEDMVFDSEKQMLHCHSCGHSVVPEQAAAEIKTEKVDVTLHKCPNCGAELVTEPETAATFCTFCGAPEIIPEKVSGEFAPSMVIPFKLDKNDAIQAFKKWCKNGRITPRGYLSQERIDKITGIYVPFFLYDCKANTTIKADCTRVRTWRSGNTEYTVTSHFAVYRDVDTEYLKVPADASEKMDDQLMDKLEPFHYGELRPFAMPYLSGFMAEKYSVSEDTLLQRALQRINGFAQEYVRSTIQGYSSVNVLSHAFQCREKRSSYVLLPVWIMNYDYMGKKYTFAMNGQTGKVVGKPPISIGKVLAWFFGIMAAVFTIVFLIGGFLH